MAVPTHFRFVFRGIFVETPEIWSFSCKFSRDVTAGTDAEVGDIDAGAVTAALTTFLAGEGSAQFGQNVKATDWRAYEIDTTGHLAGNPLVTDVSEDSIDGSGGTPFPPQVALVVTTVAADRGPAKLGRFYLPGPTCALSAGMRLSEANAEAYAELTTDFLKGISAAIDLPLDQGSSHAVNISPHGNSGAGTRKEVRHLEVGRCYDTLRTRRNKMLEERHVHGDIDW